MKNITDEISRSLYNKPEIRGKLKQSCTLRIVKVYGFSIVHKRGYDCPPRGFALVVLLGLTKNDTVSTQPVILSAADPMGGYLSDGKDAN
jgi:hypothetical protein